MFSPASFVEGWAHYAEQMMVEAGFARSEPAVRLGQLAESLIRLARFVVSIRLHAEDMSVEAGMRFFRDEAFMEEAGPARRRAGDLRPHLLVYSAGKLMLQKLRADYRRRWTGSSRSGPSTTPCWDRDSAVLGPPPAAAGRPCR